MFLPQKAFRLGFETVEVFRDVFWILSDIYDGVFLKNSQRHLTVNYFRKTLHLRYLKEFRIFDVWQGYKCVADLWYLYFIDRTIIFFISYSFSHVDIKKDDSATEIQVSIFSNKNFNLSFLICVSSLYCKDYVRIFLCPFNPFCTDVLLLFSNFQDLAVFAVEHNQWRA